MRNEVGVIKGKKFIDSIHAGIIKVDKRPNHGEEFYGGHEKQHSKIFHDYLGSCTRYLGNKHMKGQKYHG